MKRTPESIAKFKRTMRLKRIEKNIVGKKSTLKSSESHPPNSETLRVQQIKSDALVFLRTAMMELDKL